MEQKTQNIENVNSGLEVLRNDLIDLKPKLENLEFSIWEELPRLHSELEKLDRARMKDTARKMKKIIEKKFSFLNVIEALLGQIRLIEQVISDLPNNVLNPEYRAKVSKIEQEVATLKSQLRHVLSE